MAKISIIIPVYNAEQYLEECLLSISQQTFGDFEILAINDGSTDCSLEILNQYLEKESRLKVLSQANQGVSAARNLGLENAKGDYIAFVDADDFLISHYWLDNLYQNAHKSSADIVGAGFTSYFSNQKTSEVDLPFSPHVYLKKEIVDVILPYFFYKDSFNAIFTKLYSRHFIEKHQISFPLELTIAEDTYFNIQAFSYAAIVSIIADKGYAYRELQGSATKNVLKNDYLEAVIKVYQFDHGELTQYQVNDIKIKELKNEKLVNSVISLMHIYINPENQLSLRARWKKIKEIVQHKTVEKVFSGYRIKGFNKYEEAIFVAIKKKQIIILFLYNYYSYLRNKY